MMKLKEKKNLITIFFINLILILILITGCIEETQSNDKIINVNTDFNPETSGWMDTHFNNIQEAINAADEKTTISVDKGQYYENIIINKTINLIGENQSTTIINGNGKGDVIYISENGSANISGFTITNSGNGSTGDIDAGIEIMSNKNNITNNNLSKNKFGIYTTQSERNNITNNIFQSNINYGISMYTNSNFNTISNNIFSKNDIGLRIKGSKYNEIKKNIIKKNDKGIYL